MVSASEVQEEKKTARATKKIDNQIDLDVILLSIVPKAGQVRAAANRKKILSPKSSRALDKLEAGNIDLVRAEKNAMKLLINRLADEGSPVEEMG